MVTSSILLYTDAAYWTIFCVGTDVINGLGVVGAFVQPALDDFTGCWCVIIITTRTAPVTLALYTLYSFTSDRLCIKHYTAVCTRTKLQLEVVLNTILKDEVVIPDSTPI